MPDAAMSAMLAAAGLDWIVPDWHVPANVHAVSTTRRGAAGREMDFSPRGADIGAARSTLRSLLPAEPRWLSQEHGRTIVSADADQPRAPQADGAVARVAGRVCAVLTADCLPVLLADREGSVVAAVHAGWRGLAAGVLEAAVDAVSVAPASLLAWLGPAIGPSAFEVGADVYAAFCDADPAATVCFVAGRPGKWYADLYALARRRLARSGVSAVYGGGRCTFSERETFYSYRRGGAETARRMATLVWREDAA
ncbi:MAG TPA: peptidoglycan editing factor PgeF [Casimicrobiaceae bacterium]|nr:peptidoglycan editing factor PgeF [Casimicrobiaceae bacterium]